MFLCSASQTVCLAGGGKFFAADGLLFVRKPGRIPGSNSIGLAKIRAELYKKLNVGKQKRTLVFLFSRQQGSRNLANKKEVAERMKQWIQTFGLEFHVVDPSSWSMAQ